jgi:hypothetical protein
MALAFSLVLTLLAALPVGTRHAARPAAVGDGPPFVLAWREAPNGSVVLDVVSRWAEGGAITLARQDSEGPTPRSTLWLAPRAERTFAWIPASGRAGRRPMRVTATWRDPAGRAGGTATAVWPEPEAPPTPRFVPVPPVRVHGLHLDQAITLP